jgi:hypothetical protein
MTPLGQAALKLAARGLRVFPCGFKAKEPAIKDNLRLAAIDETVIRKFWGEQGRYNIGVATGPGSGIWVLDVDADENGEQTLNALVARHGPLPPTVEAITANGRHLYWKWPVGVEIRNAQLRDDLPGLDWRGEGGYVIAPPPIHPSGRAYAWSVDSANLIADAPKWLIQIVTQRPGSKSGANGVEPALPREWQPFLQHDHEGSRRAYAIARIFGHLIRKYVDPAVALALAETFDAARNHEPLGHAEVVRICNAIAFREVERRNGNES